MDIYLRMDVRFKLMDVDGYSFCIFILDGYAFVES